MDTRELVRSRNQSVAFSSLGMQDGGLLVPLEVTAVKSENCVELCFLGGSNQAGRRGRTSRVRCALQPSFFHS